MSFLKKPVTQYSTNTNYPDTGEASKPESEGQQPSVKRLSAEDYFKMMGMQLSVIAEDVAQTKALIHQAEDRQTTIRVTQFDTAYQLPQNDRWRTAYISRPSIAEALYTTGLTAKDLTIYWDNDFATIVPYYGQIVIPVFGYHELVVHNAGPGGAGTYPTSWAIDIMLTTRQYNPTQWAVSA